MAYYRLHGGSKALDSIVSRPGAVLYVFHPESEPVPEKHDSLRDMLTEAVELGTVALKMQEAGHVAEAIATYEECVSLMQAAGKMAQGDALKSEIALRVERIDSRLTSLRQVLVGQALCGLQSPEAGGVQESTVEAAEALEARGTHLLQCGYGQEAQEVLREASRMMHWAIKGASEPMRQQLVDRSDRLAKLADQALEG
eukprot:CAMPEP_0204325832 /NCGR_PEP_ID=MMETSP0469-20131031/11333_1 /ASSEMBLY_ACC=CAM_ASM_000384 /TAXON_ID=2969 /ORGANISM="Oxyrrhis marina" /LENGTH=198 /DNA_ID=CAMNT_0051307761 /DNA_START=1 /DNA_END=594 /DNA_ORIENTATION=+